MAPRSSQRYYEVLLRPFIDDGQVVVYLDSILIHSSRDEIEGIIKGVCAALGVPHLEKGIKTTKMDQTADFAGYRISSSTTKFKTIERIPPSVRPIPF